MIINLAGPWLKVSLVNQCDNSSDYLKLRFLLTGRIFLVRFLTLDFTNPLKCSLKLNFLLLYFIPCPCRTKLCLEDNKKRSWNYFCSSLVLFLFQQNVIQYRLFFLCPAHIFFIRFLGSIYSSKLLCSPPITYPPWRDLHIRYDAQIQRHLVGFLLYKILCALRCNVAIIDLHIMHFATNRDVD